MDKEIKKCVGRLMEINSILYTSDSYRNLPEEKNEHKIFNEIQAELSEIGKRMLKADKNYDSKYAKKKVRYA